MSGEGLVIKFRIELFGKLVFGRIFRDIFIWYLIIVFIGRYIDGWIKSWFMDYV